MNDITILLAVFLAVALAAIGILALGLVDALKRIKNLDDYNAQLFDQNQSLKKENIGRRRKGVELGTQIADLTAARDDLQAKLDHAHKAFEEYRSKHPEQGKVDIRDNVFYSGDVQWYEPTPPSIASREDAISRYARAIFGGPEVNDPETLRKQRDEARTEAREERQQAQELRVLLTAAIYRETNAHTGYPLTAKEIQQAERKLKLRYQRDGNTGAVTLRAVPIAATENVGKFL